MKKLSFFHTPFFFFITYKILTCERRLYLPFTTYKSTTESATLRPLNSGLSEIHLGIIVAAFQQLLHLFLARLSRIGTGTCI